MTAGRAALFLVLLAAPAGLLAHSSTASSSEISVSDEAVEISFHTRDMDLAFVLDALDTDQDGALSQGELDRGRKALEDYFRAKCEVRVAGELCPGKLLEVLRVDPRIEEEHPTNLLLRLRYPLPGHHERVSLRIHPYEENDPLHQHLATVRVRGEPPVVMFFVRDSEQVLDLGPRATSPGRVTGAFPLGIEHILTGWDHLLFLAALILVVDRPLALLGIISGFTAGHTVTLILAALNVLALPSRFTESAIAFSIAYTAFENTRPHLPKRRWLMALLFGLVHGFGFASSLRDLLPPGHLIESLLLFNLGVEAGQLAMVAMAWPLLRLVACRCGWAARGPRALSWGIFTIGAALMVLRICGAAI